LFLNECLLEICESKLYCTHGQAVSTYGSDPEMTNLLDTMDFFVLPVFNVDGYEYTWSNVGSKHLCYQNILFILCSKCIYALAIQDKSY